MTEYKFKVGEVVRLPNGHTGVVIERYTTSEKVNRYRVEQDEEQIVNLQEISIWPVMHTPSEPKPKYQVGDVVRSDIFCVNYTILDVGEHKYLTDAVHDNGSRGSNCKFGADFLEGCAFHLVSGPTFDAQKAREEHYSATSFSQKMWGDEGDFNWGGAADFPPPPEPTEYIPTWGSEKWSEPTTCHFDRAPIPDTEFSALSSRYEAAAAAAIKEYKGTLRETPFCAYSQQNVEVRHFGVGKVDPLSPEEATMHGQLTFYCPACHDDKEE